MRVSDNKRTDAISPLVKIVTWILVLSPILQTYGWGKYDFAFILTCIAGLLTIVSSNFHIKSLPRFLLVYLLYWVLVHALSASSFSFLGVVSLGALKTILVYCSFFSIIPLSLLLKYYKIVVKVSIFFFAIQLVVKYLFDYNLLGVFSFLPLALGADASVYFEERLSSERLSSFYSEPAIFAQYLVPYLCLLLFDNSKNSGQRIVSVLGLVVVLALMRSGNALFGLVACVFFSLLLKRQGGKRILQTSVLVVGLIILGSVFLHTEIGKNMMSRKEQVNYNSIETLGYSTSGFDRIYKGYYIYSEYSIVCKVFGNDNPEYKKTAALNSNASSYFSEESQDYLYCNTFQMILLNTGIIGVLIMVFVFGGIWKNTNRCGKNLLLTFITFSFFSASYFSEIMCIYLLIPTLLGRCQSHYE